MDEGHPIIRCPCVLYLSWRRVGTLLCRADNSDRFRSLALRRTRDLFVELLDELEGVQPPVGAPVAAGVPRVTSAEGQDLAVPKPPPAEPPGGPRLGAPTEERTPAPGEIVVGPAQATSKAAAPPPPETAAAVPAPDQEETKSPAKEGVNTTKPTKEDKPHKKKKDRSTKEKKPKRSKSQRRSQLRSSTPVKEESEEGKLDKPPRTRRRRSSTKDSRSTRREKRSRPARADQSLTSQREEDRERQRERRRSPSRREKKRRDSRSRSRGRDWRRDGRHPGGRDTEQGSASSRGHLPPPEPATPPQRWTPAPRGPPPEKFYSTPYAYSYWKGYNRVWTQSKGAKRRARAEDIRVYGTDPERKADRERRDRGG